MSCFRAFFFQDRTNVYPLSEKNVFALQLAFRNRENIESQIRIRKWLNVEAAVANDRNAGALKQLRDFIFRFSCFNQVQKDDIYPDDNEVMRQMYRPCSCESGYSDFDYLA